MKHSVKTWVTFAVFVPLAPLLATLLVYLSAENPQLLVVFSGAQLLLVGIPLSAKSIGDVLPARKEHGDSVDVLVGVSVVLIILATFYYAVVACGGLGEITPKENLVAGVSSVLYIFLVALSFACFRTAQKIQDA